MNSKMKTLLLSLLLYACSSGHETDLPIKPEVPEPVQKGKIEIITTRSQVMNKDIMASVIIPGSYEDQISTSVLYLLHGFAGDHTSLPTSIPSLQSLADKYGYIIVCPNGGKSWYIDSPIDQSTKYETYITKELVAEIDNKYNTIKDRKGRAIAGSSMGGHGAMYLALRNQNLFGAVGSICGGVDFRSFPNKWELSKILGNKNQYPENWENYTVINMTSLLTPTSLDIIFDCGTEDPYFKEANEQLHKKLTDLSIPHKYITQFGMHDYFYIGKAIEWQTDFFYNYFTKSM